MTGVSDVATRIAQFDWSALHTQLDADGHAVTEPLLDVTQRQQLIACYEQAALFRSRVIMQKHRFGRGEYQYFTYPLPSLVQELRAAFYAQLAPLANTWMSRLGLPIRYPPRLDAFLARCHAAQQCRPTPLLLRYGAGDYNCLHQDLYGEHRFALQVIVQLSDPDHEFRGGELVLVEQRPRMQSIARVAAMRAGAATIIAVRERPVAGVRGWYRSQHRHGVSTVTAGLRHVLGLILHDAA